MQNRKLNRIQRTGASYAVKAICLHFGLNLVTKVPVFWNQIESLKGTVTEEWIKRLYAAPIEIDKANELITAMQLIEVATPCIHSSLHSRLFSLLPHMSILLKHPLKAVSFFSEIVFN